MVLALTESLQSHDSNHSVLGKLVAKSPELAELLLKRRSTLAANMRGPGPDREALDTLLRIATRVPDHGKLTPWRIQVLWPEGQARLGDICARIFREDNPDASEEAIAFERQRPQRSPLLLVVTSHPNMEKLAKVPLIEQQISAGAVCQNLLVGATALGFASQLLTDWPAYHPKVRCALGHSEDTEIIGFVHIGSPAKTPPMERPRPEIEDVVSEWSGARADRRST